MPLPKPKQTAEKLIKDWHFLKQYRRKLIVALLRGHSHVGAPPSTPDVYAKNIVEVANTIIEETEQ